MRGIKPQRLGLLTRTFENAGECYLAVSILGHFALDGGELLSEAALWKLVGDELGAEGVLDASMPKTRGEVLVWGRAYAPGGKPRPATAVKVTVGALEKSLWVVGDRHWTATGPSDPAPFTEMPVDWAHAFGGEGFARNPVGKGFAPVDGPKGKVHHLPNVEHPRKLIQAARERPEPAGFAPFDFTWPQRFAKTGTYDQKWLKERYPGFAADLNWDVWNAAPEDQWLAEGYFTGGERIVVENMHPRKAVVEGRVPELVPRCLINCQAAAGGEELREVAARLDTVWLFPHLERGIVIFHGMTQVAEDDARDVLQIVIAGERPGEPRPVEHYREVLRQRLDKERGPILALRDSDLMPPGGTIPRDDALADEAARHDNLLARNARKKAERQILAARATVAALGLDPDEHAPGLPPPEAPPPSLEEMPAHFERMQAEAQEQREAEERVLEQRKARAKVLCEEAGIPWSKIEAEFAPTGGPPTFDAAAEIARLWALVRELRSKDMDPGELEGYLNDPSYTGRIHKAEEGLRDGYRRSAHLMPPAPPRSPEAALACRDRVLAAHAAGQSLAGVDLTGADLSGLDLTGIDLTWAFLEQANLRGACLERADLSNATLARADLAGVSLAGAKLTGANLGGARLAGASLRTVDLAEVILAKADLTGADLQGASLVRADLSEAILVRADLTKARAPEVMLLKNDLSGVIARKADFRKANFLELSLAGADLSGANLDGAVFLAVKADGVVLRDAHLENLRAVQESSLAGADLRGAHLVRANLRGCKLEGADLTGARLAGADLSEADLRRAKLDRATAREAQLVRADLTDASLVSIDLMGGSVQKATIEGANFTGANLYGADFAKVLGDGRTRLKGANQKKVRVHPVRRPR